uniref:Uncharacterized protein n=1 Tax=Timema shepardi TaxID=629360 RepID=A0A7R9G435_TIMSH|nr:unnamed protein product [Timema shepardi]
MQSRLQYTLVWSHYYLFNIPWSGLTTTCSIYLGLVSLLTTTCSIHLGLVSLLPVQYTLVWSRYYLFNIPWSGLTTYYYLFNIPWSGLATTCSIHLGLVSPLTVSCVLAAVRADTSSDLASLQQEVNPQDLLKNITSLSGVPSLNDSHIPTVEEAENAFKKKCLQNADEQAFDRSMESVTQVSECVKSLVNVTQLKQEVEKAKPTGDLDVVFRKYCKYSLWAGPALVWDSPCDPDRPLSGTVPVTLTVPCLGQSLRAGPALVWDSPCDPDRPLPGTYLPKNTTSLNSIPSLVLEEPECRDMKLLQSCVVKVLEGCSEPTPANIVESLFNYVWQMTPCHAMKSLSRTGADPNSAPRETAAVLGLTAASLLLALALGPRV